MTRQKSRCRLRPPSQQTRQSPNREPGVTAVQRRRYFVSSCMTVDQGTVHTFMAPGSWAVNSREPFQNLRVPGENFSQRGDILRYSILLDNGVRIDQFQKVILVHRRPLDADDPDLDFMEEGLEDEELEGKGAEDAE